MVEVYAGRLDPSDRFIERFTRAMNPAGPIGDHLYRYACEVSFEDAGHFGLNIRVTPDHPNPESRHATGLVIWGRVS